MEFIVIVSAVLLVVYLYKRFTKPNSSDKLTLLQFENWVSIYSNGNLFEKSNMATALVIQSIIMANGMGVDISVNEFMSEKNKSKESSIDIINNWLDCIFNEMINDIPLDQLNLVPARVIGAMVILKMISPSRYSAFLRGN